MSKIKEYFKEVGELSYSDKLDYLCYIVGIIEVLTVGILIWLPNMENFIFQTIISAMCLIFALIGFKQIT